MDALRWVRNQWDRAIAIVAGVAGALALLLGWLGMARSVFPAEQLPYIVSGGLAGLFYLGIGATAWLSADMRDEWRKLDRLEEQERERSTSSLPWDGEVPAVPNIVMFDRAPEDIVGSRR